MTTEPQPSTQADEALLQMWHGEDEAFHLQVLGDAMGCDECDDLGLHG